MRLSTQHWESFVTCVGYKIFSQNFLVKLCYLKVILRCLSMSIQPSQSTKSFSNGSSWSYCQIQRHLNGRVGVTRYLKRLLITMLFTYRHQFHHRVFLLLRQTCHNRSDWLERWQSIRYLVSDTQRMRCRFLQNGNPILKMSWN